MTQTYNITGMTCSGCQATVQNTLAKVNGVTDVTIDLSKGEAVIGMSKHVPTIELQEALKRFPKYQLVEAKNGIHEPLKTSNTDSASQSWLLTYKPIMLIFGYITATVVLIEIGNNDLNWIRAMENFMAAFFLVFSFFKLLDLRGFADSYSTYDIVARRWKGWSYVYALIELTLGIAFLVRFNPLVTNIVTFAVMSVSVIGVLQSVRQKRKIKCACLGSIFNLPMSTVTIIEDALMIGMSLFMITTLANR